MTPASNSPSGGRFRQAFRYRRPSSPRVPRLAYPESELLRRNEEFNRAAEQQWHLRVEGWPDSRAPHRLGARLELLAPPPPARLPPGTHLSVPLRATNSGDTRWLTGSPAERGAVCLGVQLRDAGGGMLAPDHSRVPLPRPVDPGEAVEIEASVPGPAESGRYRLVFELVAEQICWFEHHGSPGLALDLETKP